MKKIFLMSVFAMIAVSLFAVSVSAFGPAPPCGDTEVTDCSQFTSETSCVSPIKHLPGDYTCYWRNGVECASLGIHCKYYPACSGEKMDQGKSCSSSTDESSCLNSFAEAGGVASWKIYEQCSWNSDSASCSRSGSGVRCLPAPSCADADGDGYNDATCGGDDCDDANAEVHPGAIEIIGDAFDNDCDGTAVCDSSAGWMNHGQYVNCVARETSNRDGEVALAAKSMTGKAIFGDGETTWLGLTSLISIIALVVVALSAFKGMKHH